MKIGDPDNNSKREKEKKLQTQNKKKRMRKEKWRCRKEWYTMRLKEQCDDGIIIFLFFVRKKFRKLKKIKCGYSVNHSVFYAKHNK